MTGDEGLFYHYAISHIACSRGRMLHYFCKMNYSELSQRPTPLGQAPTLWLIENSDSVRRLKNGLQGPILVVHLLEVPVFLRCQFRESWLYTCALYTLFFLAAYLELLLLHYYGYSAEDEETPTKRQKLENESPKHKTKVHLSIVTPVNPSERGCQLSVKFSVPIKSVHKGLEKRGVVVSYVALDIIFLQACNVRWFLFYE